MQAASYVCQSKRGAKQGGVHAQSAHWALARGVLLCRRGCWWGTHAASSKGCTLKAPPAAQAPPEGSACRSGAARGEAQEGRGVGPAGGEVCRAEKHAALQGRQARAEGEVQGQAEVVQGSAGAALHQGQASSKADREPNAPWHSLAISHNCSSTAHALTVARRVRHCGARPPCLPARSLHGRLHTSAPAPHTPQLTYSVLPSQGMVTAILTSFRCATWRVTHSGRRSIRTKRFQSWKPLIRPRPTCRAKRNQLGRVLRSTGPPPRWRQ